jgi:hypothetical protein
MIASMFTVKGFHQAMDLVTIPHVATLKLWQAGLQQQHDGKNALSNWRSPPRPAAKSAEKETV